MTDQTTKTDGAAMTGLARLAEVATAKIIVTADRLRTVKAHRVAVLRQDISFNGLLQPILVQENDLGFLLVDGLQRLEALRHLNFVMLDAYVLPRDLSAQSVRYCQIMANINREDLTKLERAEFIAELDATWKAMNPSAKHGGDRRSAVLRAAKAREAGDDEGAILGLSADVAMKTGLSRAVFGECIQIARNISDAAKIKIRLADFETKHKFLLKLSQQPADRQERILDMILDDDCRVKTIEDAVALIDGTPLLTPGDKVFSNTIANWSRLNKSSKEVFIDTFKADFIAVARKKGWTL